METKLIISAASFLPDNYPAKNRVIRDETDRRWGKRSIQILSQNRAEIYLYQLAVGSCNFNLQTYFAHIASTVIVLSSSASVNFLNIFIPSLLQSGGGAFCILAAVGSSVKLGPDQTETCHHPPHTPDIRLNVKNSKLNLKPVVLTIM